MWLVPTRETLNLKLLKPTCSRPPERREQHEAEKQLTCELVARGLGDQKFNALLTCHGGSHLFWMGHGMQHEEKRHSGACFLPHRAH